MLLNHSGMDVNMRYESGLTALMHSLRHPLHEKVILGGTVGRCIVERRRVDIVRALLNHSRVGVNAKDADGRAALMFAARDLAEGVVQLLLDHRDIGVNVRSNNRYNALIVAAGRGLAGVI